MPEFLIQAGALRRLAATVGAAATRRSTIPILEYICLSGHGGTLAALATDMEIAISDTAEGTGDLPKVAARNPQARGERQDDRLWRQALGWMEAPLRARGIVG